MVEMKNLFIVKADSDGNLKITEDELKAITEAAYNQGYADGLRSNAPVITPYYYGQPTTTDHITITSEATK